MNWLQYLLMVNLYLVLFYGFYALLLRRETFFKLNRIYLVASALLSFFIPLIHSDWVKGLFITQKVQYSLAVYGSPVIIYRLKPIQDNPFTLGQLMLIVYGAGVVILTGRLVWQLISLKRIIDEPGENGAFSFFKSIRLGENQGDKEVIAAHEQVHAREWHSADVLLIEVIAIINWFNPMVYFYRSAIRHIHEFIADRQALNNGMGKADYALLLLSQTLKAPAHQLVNSFFNHSLLKQRIIMLQKNQSKRAALLKYGLSAPLFILMLVLSSATVNKSKTVNLINKKVEQVFLKHTASLNILGRDTAQVASPSQVKVLVLPNSKKITSKNTGPVFTSVEHEPEFKGGFTAFAQFLSKNIMYPEAMRKDKVQGKVYITFVVKSDGSLSDIKVIRDIGYGAGEEARRVLTLSPKWNPGMQNGHPVNVQYTIPVNFALADDKAVKDTVQKTGMIEQKAGDKVTVYGDPTDNNDKQGTVSNTANPGQQQAGVMAQGFVMQPVAGTTDKYTIALGGTNQTNLPLCILDGKEVSKSQFINADDIQRIDVLKDNYSTLKLIYGQKAKYGVILITTKHREKN